MTRARIEARVVKVLPELYALAPSDEFPARALAAVVRVLGGDKGVYTEVDLRTGDFRALVQPEPSQLRSLDAARRAHTHEHPVLRHFLRERPHGARLISDFLTRAEFHRLDLYGEFFAPLGVEDQLTVVVSAPSETCGVAVSVDRGRRSFDEEDRRLLDRLRPHLVAARRNALQFSAAVTRSSGRDDPAVAAVERLTDRQRDVLALLAAGRTNGEIALVLNISVGTVRKHVEHVLRRLGVATRTAAAVSYVRGADRIPAPPWTASIPSLLRSRKPSPRHA